VGSLVSAASLRLGLAVLVFVWDRLLIGVASTGLQMALRFVQDKVVLLAVIKVIDQAILIAA
jgi:hypothetical protein